MVAEHSKGDGEVRVFEMDGSEHEAPERLTGCCGHFGKECSKCGGFMHYQPTYGGYFYRCEDCEHWDSIHK